MCSEEMLREAKKLKEEFAENSMTNITIMEINTNRKFVLFMLKNKHQVLDILDDLLTKKEEFYNE